MSHISNLMSHISILISYNIMKSENFETIAIRTQTERSLHKEHSSPIYLTSSYKFEDAEEMRALFANEKEGNV